MLIQSPLVNTGSVLPLGSTNQIRYLLEQLSLQTPDLENELPQDFESFRNRVLHDHIQIDQGECLVKQEYWISQGFEQLEPKQLVVVNLLQSITERAQKPEVILFLIDRNDQESIRELDFWLRFSLQWIESTTEVILFCYSSAPHNHPSISDDTIVNAGLYLEQEIASHNNQWLGSCNTINIEQPSPLTIAIARNLISRCILKSKGLSIMEGVVFPISSFSESVA